MKLRELIEKLEEIEQTKAVKNWEAYIGAPIDIYADLFTQAGYQGLSPDIEIRWWDCGLHIVADLPDEQK